MRPTRIAPATAAALLAACAGTSTPRDIAAGPRQGGVAPVDVPAIARPGGESADWWYRAGAARAAANGAMRGDARNVIVFVGDGMGLPTVAAARILAGQRGGAPGEEHQLAFERFPHTALSRTYNTDAQTPDSAGTMTAIATGAKTRIGHVGVGQGVAEGDCAGTPGNELLTILELAESAGLATGIVTTTRLTHATPASTYAHVPHRGWEADSGMAPEARAAGCADIAAQFVGTPFGDGPEVALAGGWGPFLPDGEVLVPADQDGWRRDGRDLLAEWRARHPGGRLVANASGLATASGADKVLGLFAPSDLPYETERGEGVPSLADMTRAAITRLQRDGDGFVLLVEGGRIDHANHDGNAHRALRETVAFSDAVAVADAMTGDDTLVLVTADHSHVMTFAGYPARGNPILGTVREAGADAAALADDGKPYTTLGYANGPGAIAGARSDPSDADTTAVGYRQQATVPMRAETHGGEDVGVWARGPGAAAVRGSVEQNVLFHFLVQATPALRDRLCAAGTCNADGVPVELPRPADFERAAR